ncbi:MAG TPA: hypothetical protein VND92_11570 [Vicinamibacterales bacterium]|nr:hypothetical protein [Vicinamibacterales bacterium]
MSTSERRRRLAGAFHPYLTRAEGITLAAQTLTKTVKLRSCCAV